MMLGLVGVGRWRRWRNALVAGGAALALMLGLAVCMARVARADEAPRWKATAITTPTVVVPGTPDGEHVAPRLIVTATNVGGAATDRSTITVADALPAGVEATKVTGFDAWATGLGFDGEAAGLNAALSCAAPPVVRCTLNGSVDPGDQLVVTATLRVASSGLGSSDQASVSGGGAVEESVTVPFLTGSEAASFGPVPGSAFAAVSTMQAGAHPDFTTQFTLSSSEMYEMPADAKDIRFDLPPGLVGSTVGLPRCSMQRVIEEVNNPRACPTDSMVGIATVTLVSHPEKSNREADTFIVPVYDIEPSPGEPAAFAFDLVVLPVRLDTTVLSDGNDGVRVTAPGLAESAQDLSTSVTIWGVPQEHSGPGHDVTDFTYGSGETFGGPDPGQTPVPLMTNPQQCAEPLVGTMSADSWSEPGVFRSEPAPLGQLTGCGLVPFGTSFSFLPDTLEAGASAGYSFKLNVPQQNTAGTLATASVRDVSLSLPEGVVVNPSAAWGLKACSTLQFYGPDHPSQAPAQLDKCPREAQVGEVEVETPDLEHPLKGQVLLGTPECEPCSPEDAADGKMVRLFIQLVGEGEAGIVVKLEGHALIDQATGQITTVFKETPELPFSRMRFVLEGGPRAVLANPRKCGLTRTTGDFTPWNTGIGVSDSYPFYEFEINQNCHGAQFDPSFVAGMTNIQSGEYGPFTLSFGRSDNDQFLSGYSQTLPPGLLGNLSSVSLCKEPQAAEGTCLENSRIGHTQVLTGPGADPFLVTGGKVFITEGYKGAPFGLSILVPAVAGPYTLSGTTGNGTVVVRARIEVDPIDAHLVVTADPLPTMLDGIPLQLKVVNVTIDRPNFTFNPTNCSKLSITANMTSLEGMRATVSSPFQVTNCARLSFKPIFAVSTSGQTSRANGASLHVKLTYPHAGVGAQANIAYVKVDLPKQLPSRLETLKQACPDSTFNINPAACPAASRVGFAKAVTPVLPVPLEGPAYFVSHGGQRFPELIVVLQGYGVTVDLQGETFISKAGITSSTFKSVPDVPVGTFELNLPEGPFSALAANTDLCTANLVMPNVFDAQNGAQIKQNTPIEVEGCPYTLGIVARRVHKQTLTLKVSVPVAGKLVASGNGVSRTAKTAKGHSTLTLTLKEGHVGKLRTKVQLRFTPSKGKQRKVLRKSITVTFH